MTKEAWLLKIQDARNTATEAYNIPRKNILLGLFSAPFTPVNDSRTIGIIILIRIYIGFGLTRKFSGSFKNFKHK
jgi:hypothetical protein